MKFEQIGKGIVKRTERRALGLFIDGTGLDRATRRINRKVDMSALVRGVTSGLIPTVARYYTLIPYEDDSRQRAFLDAVTRAGLTVIVKRLPPKGINRQVSVDIEMAADIVAFALGHSSFSDLSQYKTDGPLRGSELGFPASAASQNDNHSRATLSSGAPRRIGLFPPGSTQKRGTESRSTGTEASSAQVNAPGVNSKEDNTQEGVSPVVGPTATDTVVSAAPERTAQTQATHRIVTVVCPGRDLAYPIALAKELGSDTVNADFGQFNTGDVLKSAAKWIDLSDSETIWRD